MSKVEQTAQLKSKSLHKEESGESLHSTTAEPTGQVRNMGLDAASLAEFRRRKDVKSNVVRTSKYTWWSFVPLNLFEQFTKKLANMYFLVIMFMQMIEAISISNGQPAMLPPLTFVVVLSMIKDAYENYKRHKEDRYENNSTAEVYNRQSKSF